MYCYTLEGKPVEVTVKTQTKKRSSSQNRYYWGVVIPLISESTGYTLDEAHEAIKLKFLRIHGDKLDSVGSTKKLSTKEFEDTMEEIRAFAINELSVYIPEPNEVDYE